MIQVALAFLLLAQLEHLELPGPGEGYVRLKIECEGRGSGTTSYTAAEVFFPNHAGFPPQIHVHRVPGCTQIPTPPPDPFPVPRDLDCNGDGAIDVNDILCFNALRADVEAYIAGPPPEE